MGLSTQDHIVIFAVNSFLCPGMSYALDPTVWLSPHFSLIVFWPNPDSLERKPGTVAVGKGWLQKVTLLSGHCGLEANIGSLSKQVVLRPRVA